MIPILIILLAMMAMGGVLWVAQAYWTLRFARAHVVEAWSELRAALEDRREMVPYIVAAVPINISPALDVLGNACDLAANVEGVRECSQAEARLSTAIVRLFSQLDVEASLETLELLSPLRDRLKEHDMKVELLKEAYNRQAGLFNALLEGGAAKTVVSLGMAKPVELF